MFIIWQFSIQGIKVKVYKIEGFFPRLLDHSLHQYWFVSLCHTKIVNAYKIPTFIIISLELN